MSAIAPTGLTVLHEPPQGQPVDVDILFVHGLQGHPERTWLSEGEPQPKTGRTSTLSPLKALFKHRGRSKSPISNLRNEDNSVYWPRDLLPALCPTSRIMTFGYDTMATKGYVPADKGSIFSHARDLLYELERNRPRGRYLIFVAHSLGGILVKEVLRRSENSSEESIRDIIDYTVAVVFMGTPHRGSPDFASPADVARRVAQTVLRMDTNPAVLRALGLDSPELELCRESFITQWRTREFIVKTFQESHGIVGVNVVPDTSSSLDDPREHAETLPADHMGMCRFSGAEDPKWRKVGPELQRLSRVRRAFEHACETSLAFPELSHRQEAITDPLQNTCDWVFQSDTYRSWVSRTNPRTLGGFLWLKGKPGSGKSTLMKEGVKRMTFHGDGTGARVVIAPFFFNARGSHLERSPLGMLRALCYHLLRQDEHFRTHLANHYQAKSQLDEGKWEPREDELRHLVTTGFRTRHLLAMVRVVFFIEGPRAGRLPVIGIRHDLTGSGD
ncbi:hypothetical protein CONLIGDRAFT_687035 [Coniochaeta ligniaria NRRL 30616]|uniref:Nephrocystin 3-like N-terminal domain-containing protein n=1 Tax=Coniochaeta ligniaria NRRL 30616 TaxID=1408157 RepID=A0A1J7I6F6_9PEZI|nr:hypothetical protein CONLIGDRAFT_687035 [Coniochaeta ligniaria NRRL 30616]